MEDPLLFPLLPFTVKFNPDPSASGVFWPPLREPWSKSRIAVNICALNVAADSKTPAEAKEWERGDAFWSDVEPKEAFSSLT